MCVCVLNSVQDVCIEVFLDAITETQLGLEWKDKAVLLFSMPKILQVWKLEVPELITKSINSVFHFWDVSFYLQACPVGYKMAATASEIIAFDDSIQKLEDEERA